MPFEGKGLASKNAHCGEKSPAVEQTGLTRRKARLLDRHDMAIVGNVSMDHVPCFDPAKQTPSLLYPNDSPPLRTLCAGAHVPAGNKPPFVQLTRTKLVLTVD